MSNEAGQAGVSRTEQVLVVAASTSTKSINRALARTIHADIGRRNDVVVGLVDLVDYPMPLYQADLELADGVPAAAHELAARVQAAEVLVIVSPEYNRAFPPLLKNTVDWLSRVDRGVLGHLTVLLASATPGPGGGVSVLAMIRQWLTSIRVTVADVVLSVPSAELDPDGNLPGIDPNELARFTSQLAVSPSPSS
jgi:NAD(P)H-dependent FMN reductase